MNNKNLTEGILWQQLLGFTVPIFLSSVLQQFYNMIDVWFLGNYVGTNAVAAAGGVSGSFIAICISLFNGFSSAVTIVIGQLIGQGWHSRVKNVIYNTVLLSVVLGAIMSAVCIGITPAVLKACGVRVDILDMAISYLQIYFLGLIPMFVYNLSSGMMRAMGDSRTPLYILGMGCVVNIIGDAFTMLVLGWGVEGAAIATILAQGGSALVNLYILLCHKTARTDAEGFRFRLDLRVMGRIIALGVPCGVQNMMYTFANLILHSSINRYGTETIAAQSIYSKVDSICWWGVESYGVALTTIVAQNYGAGNKERVRNATRLAVLMATVTDAIFAGLFYIGAEMYFRMFTGDENVIAVGLQMAHQIVPFYLTYSLIDTLSGTIKGLGKTVEPMIITFAGVCLLRVIWVFVVQMQDGSYAQLLWNYPVTWIATSIMFLVYYEFYIKKRLL